MKLYNFNILIFIILLLIELSNNAETLPINENVIPKGVYNIIFKKSIHQFLLIKILNYQKTN